jgi:hypothetical protein
MTVGQLAERLSTLAADGWADVPATIDLDDGIVGTVTGAVGLGGSQLNIDFDAERLILVTGESIG